MAITTNIVSAAVIGGELVIGLADGSIIRAGMVQGAKGPKGDPGPVGPQGADGEDGATILNGEGPPRPEIGRDGDWYIDVTATDLWGPKVGGRWLGPVHLLSEAARRDRIGGQANAQALRSGPAFFGGVGSPGTTGPAQTPTQGLTPIIPNGQPQPANMQVLAAEDDRGELFDVDIRATATAGVWTGTVRVSRFGATADYTVFGVVEQGNSPPKLTFTPQVDTATGKLQLFFESDVALTKIQGVQILVQG